MTKRLTAEELDRRGITADWLPKPETFDEFTKRFIKELKIKCNIPNDVFSIPSNSELDYYMIMGHRRGQWLND